MTAILCLMIFSGCQNDEYSLAGSGSVTINLQQEYGDVQVDCINADIQKISSTKFVLNFDSLNSTQAVISSSGYQTKYLNINAVDISTNKEFDIALDSKHYVVKVKVDGIDANSENAISFNANNTDIIQQDIENDIYELHTLQPIQDLQIECDGYKTITFNDVVYNNYNSNIKAILLANNVADRVCFIFKNNEVTREENSIIKNIYYKNYTDYDSKYENVDSKYSHYTMEISSLEDIVINDIAYSVKELNSKTYHAQTLENSEYASDKKEIYFESIPSDLWSFRVLSEEINYSYEYFLLPRDMIGQNIYFMAKDNNYITFIYKLVVTQEQYDQGIIEFPTELVDNRTVTIKRQEGSDAIYNNNVGIITVEGVEISLYDLISDYVYPDYNSDVKFDIIYKDRIISSDRVSIYDEVFVADLFNENINEFVFSTKQRETFTAKVKFMAEGQLANDFMDLSYALGEDGYYTFTNIEDGDIIYTYNSYYTQEVEYSNFMVPFHKNVYTYNEEEDVYYYTVNIDIVYSIKINITNIDYVKDIIGYSNNININATFNGDYLYEFNEIDFSNYQAVELKLSKKDINKVLQIDINIESAGKTFISYTVRKVTQEDIEAGKIDLELIFIEIM